MRKLSELSKSYARGLIILVFLAADIFLNAVVFANMSAVLAPNGPIDLKFFYTPETAYSMVAAYGPNIRAQYQTFALTADVIYPIVYTILFSLLISWLFRRGLDADHRLHMLNLVPLGAGIFDLLENLAIVGMLSGFPATPTWLAWIATLFTMVKWSFAAASLLLILYGVFLVIRNRGTRS